VRSWIDPFSLPCEPADDAIFGAVMTAHGSGVASWLLRKHAPEVGQASEGLVEFVRSWIDAPGAWQTAWDISFGRAHLALKESKLDPVEAAIRMGIHIAASGHVGAWQAWTPPTVIQFEDRVLEGVTLVAVDNDVSGRCVIRFRLSDGIDIELRRSSGSDSWAGEGGHRLISIGRNRAIRLLPKRSLPAGEREGEVFQDCQPVSEITGEAAESFEAGMTVLERNTPQYVPWVERVLCGIVVCPREAEFRLVSGSWEDVPGLVHMSSPHNGIDIAEILVHEAAHQYFYMLQRVGPVDDSTDNQLYWSPPIRKNRPLSRILMAYHALANVQLLFEAVRSNETNDKWDIEYVRVNEPDLQAAIRALDQPLRGNPALTKLGRGLYDLLAERMAELMEMTVPRALASGS